MKKRKYNSPIMKEIELKKVVLLSGSVEQMNVNVNTPDDEVDAELAL